MHIERMTVAVRPRNGWEALDLGFRMVRAWWRPIYAAWLAVLLPVALLLTISTRELPWLAWLLLWWLKPIWDRIPLFVLSRTLFGNVPSLGETLKALPAAMRPHGFASLTWLRFSPFRTATLPVDLLEGLSGSKKRKRKGLLLSRATDSLLALTCFMVVFEWLVLFLGLFLLADFLIPDEISSGENSMRIWGWMSFTWLWLAVTSFIEPFYVAAGFSLYLNRRTILEGWDLELAFKRLALRVRRDAGKAAMFLLILIPFVESPAWAETGSPSRADIKAELEEVMNAPEFQRLKNERTWQLKDFETGEPSRGAPLLGLFLARFLKYFIICGFLALLGYLVYLAATRLGMRRLPQRRGAAPPAAEPSRSGALDTPEGLPADITHAAGLKWRQGKRREALSLLYRGALAELSRSDETLFGEDATEDECLALAREHFPDRTADYFSQITRVWTRAAYAEIFPGEDLFHQLRGQWHQLGGRVS